MNFVHLHCHSEYSIRDSLVRIPKLLEKVKAMRMPAIALTDYMNLFATIKFYRRAQSMGLKPILGADIVLEHDGKQSRETLLCCNQAGYHHLTCLMSRAYCDRGQGDPVITWDALKHASEGLIVLSSGIEGDVSQALMNKDMDLAKQRLDRWRDTFGDRYYLSCQRIGVPHEADYLLAVFEFAQTHAVPVVATNPVCFIEKADYHAHEARVCINQGYVLDDHRRQKTYTSQQYLRTPEQMQILFQDVPAVLENSLAIAARTTVNLEFGNVFLPTFSVPKGLTLESYLEQQSEEGLMRRLVDTDVDKSIYEDYKKRLAIELDVINRMGFPGYFLIVADFIGWAKSKDIPVGPGRGSGAGSLVAYSLGITELDPIHFGLLFERFLNPERVSMPDFDIDFCMSNRDRVIEYVGDKYGYEAVSQIITYGTMAAKAVIRDVGRVLGHPYGFVDKIAKLIPFELGITLDKALEQEPALATRYREDVEVTSLIDLAKKLEGLVRNAGRHAGGVVIAPTRLTDFVPTYCESGSTQLVTQFDKDDVETVGLVKFDFLGLRTLTIIAEAVENVKGLTGDTIVINQIPLNDEPTFKMLQATETTAVFQLESRGMKELVARLVPDKFEDLIALVALFRPGPLQSGMVDDFIDRKHGRDTVTYLHSDLESILNETYGVILYQEQVMQIAQSLAGYSLGAADMLRRAMGKKKPEEMAKQRDIFLQGAKENKVDEAVATEIFDLMEKFAGYGFNKSHSAAYALIAYQTAWLKAHYPAAFMAAVLSSDMDNTDKVLLFYQEACQMGLPMLSPSIQDGEHHFKVTPENDVRYGLGAIKGVGEQAVLALVEEREANGRYKDLFDLTRRVDLKKVGKRTLEPLIESGAFDCFSENRASLMASVEAAVKAAQRHQNDALSGQVDLFGSTDEVLDDPTCRLVDVPPWSEGERLKREKAALGLYLSGHPMGRIEQEVSRLTQYHCGNLVAEQQVTLVGVLVSQRHLVTKKGKRMAILTIEDMHGTIDVTIFSNLYHELVGELEADKVYCIQGKTSHDNFTQGVRLVADSVTGYEILRKNKARGVCLTLTDQHDLDAIIAALPNTLSSYSGGRSQVLVRYEEGDTLTKLRFGESWRVTVSEELINELARLLGQKSVTVAY